MTMSRRSYSNLRALPAAAPLWWALEVGVLAITLATPACSGKKDAAKACATLSSVCPAVEPSYKEQIFPIVEAKCNNCHSASVPNGPWPFDSYESIVDWQLLIVDDIQSCRMPPADADPPLSEAERTLINDWLVCGAKNN